MTSRRTVVAAAVLWCVVVAVVASLVWVVIARAGQGVMPLADPQAAVTGSPPPPHGGTHPSHGVVVPPRHSSSRSAGPSPGGPTSSGGPPSNTPTTTPPAPERRSWSGSAGHMVAECRGTSVALVSAFPDPGWRYQIASRGPAEVQVRFSRIGEDRGTVVTARCVSGVPRFSSSGDESGND